MLSVKRNERLMLEESPNQQINNEQEDRMLDQRSCTCLYLMKHNGINFMGSSSVRTVYATIMRILYKYRGGARVLHTPTQYTGHCSSLQVGRWQMPQLPALENSEDEKFLYIRAPTVRAAVEERLSGFATFGGWRGKK